MNEFCVAIVSVLILMISIISYIKLFRKPRGSPPPLPPGPRGLPIVGYLPFLGDDLLKKLKDLELEYGPIYKLYLGNKLNVVVSSPSLAKEVLGEQDAVFSVRETSIAMHAATFGGNDIGSTEQSSQWRALRKIFVREMKRSIQEAQNLRKEEVGKTIKHLYAEMGKPVEIGELCFSTQLKFLLNMSWGGMIAGELREQVAEKLGGVIPKITDLLGKTNISDYFPVLARLDIQGIKRQMERYSQTMDGIFNTVIAEHKKKSCRDGMKKQGSVDFLELLLELNEKGDSEISISPKQLRGLLMDNIAGATDTSAAIEWAMAELMRNPKVMAKTQKELSDVVGVNATIDEVHIPKLKYLEAVVKETLRLHPLGPLLAPKSPHQSCIVGGYTIPKNTGVLVNVWSIQRDPSIWDNPTEFKPERFLDQENGQWDYNGTRFQYLPFGSGRRICAGRALSERLILCWLAALVHSFDWELPEGEKLDMSGTYGLLLRKATPLFVIPKPRLHGSNLCL